MVRQDSDTRRKDTKRTRRKRPLLKNEIEMIQDVLRDKVYPADWYKRDLIKHLEELKGLWYKSK